MKIKVMCKLMTHINWRNIVSFLSPYCHKVSGNFSFISAKTYDSGVKMNRVDERFLLSFSLSRKIVF